MKAMVRARLGLPPLELPSRYKRLTCAKTCSMEFTKSHVVGCDASGRPLDRTH
jgi:hypothetical protein